MANWYDKNWRAFYHHQKTSGQRHIPWQLTFEQWLDIWLKSGKLTQRGRGKDQYCMARFGDSGPYAVGNVEIITTAQNSYSANVGRRRTKQNKTNIAAGIKKYWGALTDKERAERGRQIGEGQAASGSHEKAWADPKRKKRTSRRTKQWWASLTVKERKAVGSKISQAHDNDHIRKVKHDAIYARDYSNTTGRQILTLIQSNPGLTNRQIESRLGASSNSVRQGLYRWKTRGLIERKNYSGKKGCLQNEPYGGQWFPVKGAAWP